MAKVLIACEFSGIVREAFAARGHYAVSCDLLPTEIPSRNHYVGDCRDLLVSWWDLLICFPPCTYLTVSANRWFKDGAKARPGVLTGAARRQARADALDFVRSLLSAPIGRIALENPVGVISSQIRKPDQVVQPWQFWTGNPGDGEKKATCLWLKNLPPLVPTTPNETGRVQRIWGLGPSEDRAHIRSRTFPGIARAMAAQWGPLLEGDRATKSTSVKPHYATA